MSDRLNDAINSILGVHTVPCTCNPPPEGVYQVHVKLDATHGLRGVTILTRALTDYAKGNPEMLDALDLIPWLSDHDGAADDVGLLRFALRAAAPAEPDSMAEAILETLSGLPQQAIA